MSEIACIYPDRDAVLVAYLYDDIEPADRVAFETHVTACLPCRSELARLRSVRTTLAQWAPPEPARTSFLSVESRESQGPNPESRRPTAWWHNVPVWAQVAAAMLVLGASASIANLDVRYNRSGLTIRTGWSAPGPAPAVTQAAQAGAAPWRADLAALQNQLRSEMRAQSATVTAASAVPAGGTLSDAEFRRRVRALLDESEKRQETELALRIAQVQRDVNAQRQADLTRINQNLGYIQRDTYGEQLKQREVVNYLLKVSQRQ